MTIRAKFYMPYEGNPSCHGKIIMSWPGPDNPNYEKCRIARIKNELIAIAKAICHFQTVILLVHSTEVPEAERAFQHSGRYGVEIQPTDVSDLEFWMRDVAPTFVISEGTSRSILHGVDFHFNGWGGRYPSSNNTILAKDFLADRGIPHVETSVVLEGGALETDGEGTLLATESSIFNPNRNPSVSRVTIEKELCRLLGVSKIIWLPGLNDYEVTDGHIDIWARFVAPGKIVLNKPSSDNEVLRAVYDTNKRILSQATDAKGRRFGLFDIHEARLDGPIPSDADLCLSYVNYVLVNGAVIAPRFGDEKADNLAIQTLRRLFPNREVVQVYLKEIVLNGGGIHCVTQQIPIP
ncbi:hypothetical protein BDV27DRAFT_140208 [Aspergillus caelatus]|uniref:Peptidyl-arginine deiminase domain protein n=1 Tax=Aspergillus caelatus TaxID=61420 RepID=A0A5N7ANL8_9EURO|nr:uncharacterized protein BDV27DRAFT_140208 [Aspergillus caelatus]KAE8370589.1 hypothetical protein BDV27DRAFT_140208 [Aspergillus caelatus]